MYEWQRTIFLPISDKTVYYPYLEPAGRKGYIPLYRGFQIEKLRVVLFCAKLPGRGLRRANQVIYQGDPDLGQQASVFHFSQNVLTVSP